MSNKIMAGKSRAAAVPPTWTSVLAVIAHPDDASFGLGAILDAFIFAGARIQMLCLTHGQAWTVDDAPGDLAALRGAELASATDVLAPISTKVQDHQAGVLGELCQKRLAAEVVAVADACHPDGLLVFDTSEAICPSDHRAATGAALLAAETLGLPVLGWSLSETVAAQLSGEFGAGALGHPGEQVDLRVSFDRARQRLASRESSEKALPGSVPWRRLEMLAETGSLRWLRPPRVVVAEVRSSLDRSGSGRRRLGSGPRRDHAVPGLPARTGPASS